MAKTINPSIYKAAWLRYRLREKQDRIAEKLGVDKARVSRWLKQAEREGMIEFRLKPQGLADLEQSLTRQCGLEGACVVPSLDAIMGAELRKRAADKPAGVELMRFFRNEEIAKAAATYISDLMRIEDCSRVGLGGGSTMSALVRQLASNIPRMSLKFYALALSSHERFAECASTVTALAVATLNAEFRRQEMEAAMWQQEQPPPATVEGTALRLPAEGDNRVMAEAAEQYYSAATKEMDLIVTGLGATPMVPRVAQITEKDFDKIKRSGAIGDILFHFFRTDGSPIRPDPTTGIFPFTIQRLRDFVKDGKRVIVLAGGLEKVEALRNALRAPAGAKFITHVVTDEAVARAIVGKT